VHAPAPQLPQLPQGVAMANVVPRLSATPGAVRHAGRARGEDTRAVLARWLGLDAAAIDQLGADGAVQLA
ncbi:MAG TPA: hypothetical protein VMS38_34275, partial [Pseudorhodoferax sp.]|nr:hypothetical protein [Pseudorhodoferax sp.]